MCSCASSSSMNESWYDKVFVGRSRCSFEGFYREKGNACLARTRAFIFRDSVLLQERVLVAHMTRETVMTINLKYRSLEFSILQNVMGFFCSGNILKN